MPTTNSSTDHKNQRATDEELFAILRKAKEEDGIPALVTSQFNEIGDYNYSSTGLNERLMNLHEDGIIGHQKAANRHFWWLSGEGTTEPTELSSLEDLVDYNNLNPEKFDEEKAKEIAEAAIPDFKKNWWQRVYLGADDLFRLGSIIFLITLGVLAVEPTLLPEPVLGFTALLGLAFISGAVVQYIVGYFGNMLALHTDIPKEPWNKDNLADTLVSQIWNYIKGSE